MEAKAIARHIRIAPRKIRIVADLVRGKNIGDQGPTLKRIHPRSRGQAFKILKRTSHVTVVVKERA